MRKSNEKHWVNIPAVTDYNENVPPIYNDIISKCLQLMPDKRYRNGMEVAKAINYALKRRGMEGERYKTGMDQVLDELDKTFLDRYLKKRKRKFINYPLPLI